MKEDELVLLQDLMGCEHMGDVTRVCRVLAKRNGIDLAGCHGDWEDRDWDQIDAALAAGA